MCRIDILKTERKKHFTFLQVPVPSSQLRATKSAESLDAYVQSAPVTATHSRHNIRIDSDDSILSDVIDDRTRLALRQVVERALLQSVDQVLFNVMLTSK